MAEPAPDTNHEDRALSVAELHHQDTVGDLLDEQKQRLPWFLVSLAFHAMLFFIFSLIPVGKKGGGGEKEVITNIVPEEIPEMIEPEREVLETDKPIKQDEEPTEEPVIKDAEEADHNETADEEDWEQSKGQEDQLSDKPFEGKGFLSNLGLGGGGGGTFGGRFGGRRDLVARGGGGRRTEDAVNRGLKWLADHQCEDGSWDTDGYEKECARQGRPKDDPHGPCGTPGDMEWTDPGNTGLCLLAFLGAGNTHRTGPYKDVVQKAIRYLKGIQSPDGCFGAKEGHYMYNHSIAGLAMAEAYALSGKSPLIRGHAQKGIDFIALAQNPGLAWRYSVKCGDNDTSVTGWVVMALKSAKVAGLEVPRECFTGALTWVDKVTDETYWKVGYRSKGDPGARLTAVKDKFEATEAMTAVGMISRVFLGAKRDDPALRGGAELLVDQVPEWNDEKGTIDMYYWYYGTLAMFQVGGSHWKKWNEAMKGALVDTQRSEGGASGSWDPIGAWGGPGGRVYSTSINVLSLEIYYRYAKVFK